MSAKLRKPWLTARRTDPAPSVTVFLIEERFGRWYPVIEHHRNCRGMTHHGCTVDSRLVPDRGFSTMAAAEEALEAAAKELAKKGQKP